MEVVRRPAVKIIAVIILAFAFSVSFSSRCPTHCSKRVFCECVAGEDSSCMYAMSRDERLVRLVAQ